MRTAASASIEIQSINGEIFADQLIHKGFIFMNDWYEKFRKDLFSQLEKKKKKILILQTGLTC